MPVTIDLVNGVTAGPDGNVWFTLPAENAVGRMSPTGHFAQSVFPTPDSRPFRITAGPDGNLWFTLKWVDAIGRISPNGIITAFTRAPSRLSRSPDGTAPGPDGNIWFADPVAGAVGRITPTGLIDEFPTKFGGGKIVTGPDGNLWVTQDNTILRMTLTGQTTYFLVSQANGLSLPVHIANGPDGNLWFTEDFGKNVARITPTGTITEFPIPGATINPKARGIISGGIASAAGAVWVTMQDTGSIFRLSISGELTECPLPDPNGGAGAIALGPDGKLYFSEEGNKIGRLTP